ncbi:MAG: NADH-quinone oxidoreductase subunit NuoH [Ignavibacteriaceae bacterium]|nr:NADH-quinone oxidoreductase subunit NuoH [Ignavibacteriaceae bacterium]NUM69633.1 NADH-quinone oxidoreductase subunit NuoH [Ignavibacteriaceae bacterium]
MTDFMNGYPMLYYLFLAIFPLLFVIPFALMAVYAERKVSAYMQNRIGPNRTGPLGLLQTTADILKLLQKEDMRPGHSDRFLTSASPIVVFLGSYLIYAALPFNSILTGATLDLGLLFLLSVSGIVVIGILVAGWSSDNKYSLLGALRSAAQIISYEIPSVMVVMILFVITQSLSLTEISEKQTANIFNWYILGGPDLTWKKFIFIPIMIISAVILFISTLAEVNRTPFDLPEAESELVAGFHTEFSGIKFALFFLAEYANMFAVSALIATVFFGGYQSPFGYLGDALNLSWLVPAEQFFWFTIKALGLVFVQMWLRWTLPRLRIDQLMSLCWKYLIPIALFLFVLVTFITMI